jgi:hypothetical protein
MTDFAGATMEALKNAAQVVMDTLRRASPSPKISESFHMTFAGGNYYVRSELIEARMTNENDRHPVYARKGEDRSEWNWAYENDRDPQRTGWANRALDAAADDAGDEFLETYLRRVALQSRIFYED